MRSWVAWGFGLLLCWPCAARAGHAGIRVQELASAPAVMGPGAPAPGASVRSVQSVWLRGAPAHPSWHALRLARDWHAASRPLLVIAHSEAPVAVYLPPDYRRQQATKYAASLDRTFSRRAVVYELPPDLRAEQPIYLEYGMDSQSIPIKVSVVDAASYRAADLDFVRANTFFASVQASMVLVILCFFVVLRDRMFLTFILYAGAVLLYDLATSGELYALPFGAMLAPLGYSTIRSMAACAPAFAIWFILDFADLPRYTPRLARWLGVLRWPLLALAVLTWWPWADRYVLLAESINWLLAVATLLALVGGWLAWRRGSRQAGFFLLSWVPLLGLTLLRVVQLIASARMPAWLEYAFPASMAWAAVVVTVGLADRMLQARVERDQATRMAQFDALTGVLNRRAIMEWLHAVWDESPRARPAPLAVLFLDIDHFKQINDSHGHAAGDACLVALTAAVRAELGPSGVAGRYGGEEFMVVLHGAPARSAPEVAERIVRRVAALRVRTGDQVLTLTVSIGVAMRAAACGSAEALVELADAAQYRAKAEGRDRVVVARADPAAVLPAS